MSIVACFLCLFQCLSFRCSELTPNDVAIIREVYDSDNSEELFQMELERALQVGEVCHL